MASSLANEAAGDLGLEARDSASAAINPSDVTTGK